VARQSVFDADTGDIVTLRSVRFVESRINTAPSADVCSWTRLGLENGDLVEDRVTGRVNVVEDGALRELVGGKAP